MAITDNAAADHLLGRPVDPTTLTDLPGFAPLDFGHNYTYAVSPDGQTLALIRWPGSYSAGGELHVINLATWTDTSAKLSISDSASDLSFSSDGAELFWTIPAPNDPAQSGPPAYLLVRYDLKSGQATTITQLPASLMRWSQTVSAGRVAIVAVPTDKNYVSQGAPRVLVVDPAKGQLAADIQIDGAKVGQYREQVPTTAPLAGGGPWQYPMYRPGLAWDSARGSLYFVQAESDVVSVINLVKGVVVAQNPIGVPKSPWERLTDWLVPAAEAKGGPEIARRALLSPDGQRLYVLSQLTDGDQIIPATLRVIATDGMREVRRLDGLLSDFALTPDGKSLLVIQGEIVRPYGFDMPIYRDVYVLDAETLQERAHLRVEQADQLNMYLDGFSPDGSLAYMHNASAQWIAGEGWRNWRSSRLVLNQSTYDLTATVVTSGGFLSLVNTVP